MLEGRSLYALYHPALAEYLLSDRDITADRNAIANALERRIPRLADGRWDLGAAHLYIRNYMLNHMQTARNTDIDELDPTGTPAPSAGGQWRPLMQVTVRGAVTGVVAAVLEGRPVVISGGDDGLLFVAVQTSDIAGKPEAM